MEEKKYEMLPDDGNIAPLESLKNQPFLMSIENVFSICGRGTVVVGRVERGVLHNGDEVEIVGIKPTQKAVCTGIEMFHKLVKEAETGASIGVLLRGVQREEIKRGQVLATSGSITACMGFSCDCRILTKEEGGWNTPLINKSRLRFYLRTADVLGEIELPKGMDKVMPGDNVCLKVTLLYPIALNEGLKFAIRDKGRTIGMGTISKIIK